LQILSKLFWKNLSCDNKIKKSKKIHIYNCV
jgi:hypothetical protein